MEVATAETTEWVVRSTAKLVMAGLVLVGITGMYLRQDRQVGLLGLIGYLLFATGYFLMAGAEVDLRRASCPPWPDTEPGYVNDVIVAAAGGTPGATSAACNAAQRHGPQLHAGRSDLRHRAVPLRRPRPMGSGAARREHPRHSRDSPCCRTSFNRPMAVPVGLALIGLGISLWRDQRKTAAITADGLAPARVEPAAAR